MYPITRPSLALAASYGATLEEAFSSALKHDEAPAVADARLDQADEQLSQAWGGFLPSITAEGTYGRREDTGRLLDPEQWSARLAARWQLFQGGAEYAGLRSLRRTREGADASVQAARHALYARVAEAHFAALAAALELETLKSLLDLTQQRVKELSDRARIGRTRESEALAARAQLASVSAQVRAADADLGEARAGWSRVTGLSPEQAPSQPLDKDPIAAAEIPRPFPALAHFMGPARERPDVVAARRQFEAADELWQVALAGNFPKLEATGNWYLARSGSLDNGRWDAVLTLTLP
ncbi:MAG: TolC family protein, partial [Bdellovibrionales bacterium]|nr:TolC family protein [Bdellovibrionales bacterium]